MFPAVPGLAAQMIDRPGRERRSGAVELGIAAAAEPQRRGHAERDAHDMFERRPVAVPADASAGIVVGQQRLDERRVV